MKICVCGKGGSGKSTVVCLLAAAFRRSGRRVVVLDADESNSGLFWMLGFKRPPADLMDHIGGKKTVQNKMRARFSKGEAEPAMSILDCGTLGIDAIPQPYVASKEGVSLIATGKIHQAMEGCACPMGGLTREFLKKLKLEPDQRMLVDVEAGIEHFGRGVEGCVDAVIAVAEPSWESVRLAQKIMQLTRSSGPAFCGAVLNKISSVDQEDHLRRKLKELGVGVLGSVPFDAGVQSAGLEGRTVPGELGRETAGAVIEELCQWDRDAAPQA
jgi:CO dehydrogenase maturation factor